MRRHTACFCGCWFSVTLVWAAQLLREAGYLVEPPEAGEPEPVDVRPVGGGGLVEANFWQPSGGRRFGAIPPGASFLFKTHYSHGNRIVRAGFLSGWASLPMSRGLGVLRAR
jgi:hypothetical protein